MEDGILLPPPPHCRSARASPRSHAPSSAAPRAGDQQACMLPLHLHYLWSHAREGAAANPSSPHASAMTCPSRAHKWAAAPARRMAGGALGEVRQVGWTSTQAIDGGRACRHSVLLARRRPTARCRPRSAHVRSSERLIPQRPRPRLGGEAGRRGRGAVEAWGAASEGIRVATAPALRGGADGGVRARRGQGMQDG